MNGDELCPVCRANRAKVAGDGDAKKFRCRRCGDYRLSGTAESMLEVKHYLQPKLAAALSYNLRRSQGANKCPEVSSNVVERLVEDPYLPGPTEQAENLLLSVADRVDTPGEMTDLDLVEEPSVIGAKDESGVQYIVGAMLDRGMLSGEQSKEGATVTLSFEGWERVNNLRRRTTEGDRVFMAMAFGNEALRKVVNDHFKIAVGQAGFNLQTLDEEPVAGSIDERLRVEIRRAVLLVADLSDHNLGAYWEAGFAEGLGKPVIYTCEHATFTNDGTHFDTNHLHTVLWSEDEPKRAAGELKATIRATLPHLARMKDD